MYLTHSVYIPELINHIKLMSLLQADHLDSSYSSNDDSLLQEVIYQSLDQNESLNTGFPLKEPKKHKLTSSLRSNITKIDSEFRSQTKSTKVLLTKSQIEFRNRIMKYEEEIRLTLESNSDFVYDDSKNCYRRKNDVCNEALFHERKQLKYNSTKQSANLLFNIDHLPEVRSDSSRVKFSCTKTVFLFDSYDSSDEGQEQTTQSTNSGCDTIIEEELGDEKDEK